jgi:hypothetical protein
MKQDILFIGKIFQAHHFRDGLSNSGGLEDPVGRLGPCGCFLHKVTTVLPFTLWCK